jgi:hypothetical protein
MVGSSAEVENKSLYFHTVFLQEIVLPDGKGIITFAQNLIITWENQAKI